MVNYVRGEYDKAGRMTQCHYGFGHDGPHSYQDPSSPHYEPEQPDENEDDGLVDKYGDAAAEPEPEVQHDPVHHPSHYTFIPATKKHPNGIEVIDVTRWLPFAEGNVLKYILRAGRKGDRLEDLRKARQYLDFAIEFEEESNNE